MDSFELNKMAGFFLATVFVLFTLSIVSDAIFHQDAPATPGFLIEVAESAGGAASEQSAADAGPEAIDGLLASADVAAGEKVFKKCAACHTVDNGGANKVGPNLWSIVDRPIASVDGFGYSSALNEFAQGGAVVWDYDHLNQFLAAPKKYVKGTSMGFAGLKKTDDRANLVAYMREQSDSPAPLPSMEAPAADDAATGDAAAGDDAAAETEAAPAAEETGN